MSEKKRGPGGDPANLKGIRGNGGGANGIGRKGIKPALKHTDEYWAKLRRDFATCSHEYSGAYCSSALPISRNPFDESQIGKASGLSHYQPPIRPKLI